MERPKWVWNRTVRSNVGQVEVAGLRLESRRNGEESGDPRTVLPDLFVIPPCVVHVETCQVVASGTVVPVRQVHRIVLLGASTGPRLGATEDSCQGKSQLLAFGGGEDDHRCQAGIEAWNCRRLLAQSCQLGLTVEEAQLLELAAGANELDVLLEWPGDHS